MLSEDTLFLKDQLNGLHQANKMTKNGGITKTVLRTVQHIIKTWKGTSELSSSKKKCVKKKKEREGKP